MTWLKNRKNTVHAAHPCFTTPDDATCLRRYVDIARFVSLLEKRALWFAVPSTLNDAWEGYYTDSHYDPQMLARALSPHVAGEILDRVAHTMIEMRVSGASYRDTMGISCWHAGHDESDALWKIYAANNGIAVVSSVGRLKRALSAYPENVYLGSVVYLDHQREVLPADNTFWSVLWKRRPFAYEREVRAVVEMEIGVFETIREKLYNIPATKRVDPLPLGCYVQVDLDELVETICVSPVAPNWFLEAIQGLVKRYGLERQVVRSELAARPVALAFE